MILGIDAGTSAVKLAVLDGQRVALTHYQPIQQDGSAAALRLALEQSGALSLPLEQAALTGLNSEHCGARELGLPLTVVPEIEAIGLGGAFLSGLEEALVVNLGTGTTFVLVRNGQCTHLGGSGVGGGTLAGLGRRLLNVSSSEELFRMAAQGDMGKVDLRIGDLFTGTDTLNPILTASNLAKVSPVAANADWAAGLVNLVLECAGVMAVLACGGHGVDKVALLGALAEQPAARERFQLFSQLFPPQFIPVPHAACATAVGAALYGRLG